MRKWFMSGITGVVAVLVLAPMAVAAPSPAASNGSPGQGLEISPPVMELDANPGQTLVVDIRVRDVTSGELIAKGRADDFGAGTDESGEPKLLLDETGATRYSLKYWMQNVPDMDLQPQQLKTAAITIKVPADAEPGGHYGLIRFTAVPPNLNGTGVALSASVGTLVLLRVSGQITDNLSLAQFSTGHQKATPDAFTPTSFFEYGPVDFLVRAHNGGTVHEQPAGSIVVKNLFGHTVGTVTVNPKSGNVLPDSIRRFTQTLDSKKMFGYYSAKLSLKYAGSKTLVGSLGFWVIPWKLILLVIALLVILFFALKWGLHRYNEHIISQARKRR